MSWQLLSHLHPPTFLTFNFLSINLISLQKTQLQTEQAVSFYQGKSLLKAEWPSTRCCLDMGWTKWFSDPEKHQWHSHHWGEEKLSQTFGFDPEWSRRESHFLSTVKKRCWSRKLIWVMFGNPDHGMLAKCHRWNVTVCLLNSQSGSPVLCLTGFTPHSFLVIVVQVLHFSQLCSESFPTVMDLLVHYPSLVLASFQVLLEDLSFFCSPWSLLSYSASLFSLAPCYSCIHNCFTLPTIIFLIG